MIEDFESLKIFILLCESGSVQKTADLLGCDKSSVSRKLARLEKSLGRKLFEHNRRPLTMTQAAKSMLSSAQRIIEEKNLLESRFRNLGSNESMTIRLMIGNAHINFAPRLLREYSDMFPKLSFNVITPPDVKEFMDGRADLICLSVQRDRTATLSDCIFLPRGKILFVPVASPDFVRKYGMLTHPSELEDFRIYTNLYWARNDFEVRYNLINHGQSWPVKAKNVIKFSNVLMVRQAALEGDGVALSLPVFLIAEDLEAGKLVPMLKGWHRPSYESFVACKKEDWKNKTLRCFSSWWAKKMSSYEKECEGKLTKIFNKEFVDCYRD